MIWFNYRTGRAVMHREGSHRTIVHTHDPKLDGKQSIWCCRYDLRVKPGIPASGLTLFNGLAQVADAW